MASPTFTSRVTLASTRSSIRAVSLEMRVSVCRPITEFGDTTSSSNTFCGGSGARCGASSVRLNPQSAFPSRCRPPPVKTPAIRVRGTPGSRRRLRLRSCARRPRAVERGRIRTSRQRVSIWGPPQGRVAPVSPGSLWLRPSSPRLRQVARRNSVVPVVNDRFGFLNRGIHVRAPLKRKGPAPPRQRAWAPYSAGTRNSPLRPRQ